MSIKFNISPGLKPKKIEKENVPEGEEVPKLFLGPFAPKPKMFFENVLVGQVVTKKLIIQNPSPKHIQLYITHFPPPERNITLSWNSDIISANSELSLEITWSPNVAGTWRDVLTLEDGKRIKADVSVNFQSMSLVKTSKGTKTKKKLPTYVSKKVKSPRNKNIAKKLSPTKPIFSTKKNTQNTSQNPKNVLQPVNPFVNEYNTSSVGLINLNSNPTENENLFSKYHVSFTPDTRHLRRETFIVDNARNIPTIHINSNIENDCSDDSLEIPTQATPKQQELEDLLKFKLELLNFTPKTLSSDVFNPNIKKLSFDVTDACVTPCTINLEKSFEANISSETYTKICVTPERSISLNNTGETYIIANVSGGSVDGNFANQSKMNSPTFNKIYLTSIQEELDENEVTIAKIKNLKRKSTTTVDCLPAKRQNTVENCKKSYSSFTVSSYSDSYTAASELDEWILEQELNFQKWLNALLTPPAEFIVNESSNIQPLNIAKIWLKSKHEDVELAPSKEKACNRYHNSTRLNLLRGIAKNFYRNEQIKEVLAKVVAAVESSRVIIREDKNIHMDVGLQTEIISLLFMYNPLWLRIGLETIYNTVIDMKSNSDLETLSKFLFERFFKDSRLLKKHKSIITQKYAIDIKKFILKKFFALVYFLDRAKNVKLVPYDPCLFCKKAEIKENREIILKFSKELISAGIGDVIKFLRLFGYVVDYKQTYINEFNYAVTCLGSDLRDGIRLAKVMEIILLQQDLCKNLRVPAISRLQKIHNMKVVFDSLLKYGFVISNNITPKDIVDGHKEKTLNFLWQIIYKFQAPYIKKATVTIQKWWKSLPIVLKRRHLIRRHQIRETSAIKLQLWYRRIKLARKLERFYYIAQLYITREKYLKSVIKVQSFVRMFVVKRKYQKIKKSIIILQSYIRRWFILKYKQKQLQVIVKLQSYIRCFIQRNKFIKLKSAVMVLETRYIANKLAKKQKDNYDKLKYTVIYIQNKYRANKLMIVTRNHYIQIRQAVITIQHHYKAYIAKKIEQNNYLKIKSAVILIQRWYKSCKETIKVKNEYKHLKKNCIFIQRHFRAIKLMQIDRQYYLQLKQSVLIIQQKYRATALMKQKQIEYKKLKDAAVVVQKYYRAKKNGQDVRKNYLLLLQATVIIQRRFRANYLMKIHRKEYMQVKLITVKIQRLFRANKEMKLVQNKYSELKKATVFIQRRFRAIKQGQIVRIHYHHLLQTTVTIQRRFKANCLMKMYRKEYTQLKLITIKIQRLFRANKQMQLALNNYTKLKKITVFIQRRFRANCLMKIYHFNYVQLRMSTIKVQRLYRANKQMKLAQNYYVELKKATIFVQRRFRAKKECQRVRNNYLRLLQATVTIQRRFTGNCLMKMYRFNYIQLRMSTIKIQRLYRANKQMNLAQNYYVALKKATIFVQRRFRAKKECQTVRNNYLRLLQATVTIQRRFIANCLTKIYRFNYIQLRMSTIKVQRLYKANKQMKLAQNYYVALKKATIFVQRRFRAKKECQRVRTNYLRLLQTTITIQNRFRANCLMKVYRQEYIQLKIITIKFQRLFRANKQMKLARNNYVELKKTTIFVQIRFRANYLKRIERQKYLKLKEAAIVIQRWYKSVKETRKLQNEYIKLKEACVMVQKRYRAIKLANFERKNYLKLQKSVILIQQKYKAIIVMRQCRSNYLYLKRCVIVIQRKFRCRKNMLNSSFRLLRQAVVVIQQRFRANRDMKIQRDYYLKLQKTVIFIQQKYRANNLMKIERDNFKKLKFTTLYVQRYFRANKLRRIEEQKFNEFKRKRNNAATKIQAIWKGYKYRKPHPEFAKMSQRMLQANKNVIPEKTLGYLRNKAIAYLTDGNQTILLVVEALRNLDNITRICSKTCFDLSRFLPHKLYFAITTSCRSPPEMKMRTFAASILVNLTKHAEIRDNIWIPKYVDGILNIMGTCCDKEEYVFVYLCTLIWTFAHNNKYMRFINNLPNISKKIQKMKTLCTRAHKMYSSSRNKTNLLFDSYKDLPLPSLFPDWGIDYRNRPRTFINSLHAIDSLITILNIKY